MAYSSRGDTSLRFRLRVLVCVGQILRENNALSHTGRRWFEHAFCRGFDGAGGDQAGAGLKWQVRARLCK